MSNKVFTFAIFALITQIFSATEARADGLTFIRNATMQGWEDSKLLVPNNWQGDWQQAAPMECDFQETRVVDLGCPSGHTGSRIRTERRTWTATAPGQAPDWGPWMEVSTVDSCVQDCVWVGGTNLNMWSDNYDPLVCVPLGGGDDNEGCRDCDNDGDGVNESKDKDDHDGDVQ